MLPGRALGKQPARHDPRTLPLARLLLARALPDIPDRVDYSAKVSPWPMLANDHVGCCTITSVAHMTQLEAALCGTPISVSIADADVVRYYQRVTTYENHGRGYDPLTGANDTGCVELDVLRYWRRWSFAGHRLYAFARINLRDQMMLKASSMLFAGLYIGLDLPESAAEQIQRNQDWDDIGNSPSAQPGSWGGHAVNIVGYDPQGLTCITWGRPQRLSWAFWTRYCVAPETRVLTDDLRWVRIDSVSAGDHLLAFDEFPTQPRGERGGLARGWRVADVESVEPIQRPCYDLEFEDGTRVRSSAEHLWLTHHHQGAHWLTTEQLRCGPHLGSNVVKPVEVWETSDSRDAGYLAAAFDGEGHLTQRDLRADPRGVAHTSLGFSQKSNAMLAEVERCLTDQGYPWTNGTIRDDGLLVVTLKQRRELLRFLGAVRPLRLLQKFDPHSLGQMSMRTVKLVKKEFVGEKPVVAMRTSTGTFFAEGLASHNCDEAYACLGDIWMKERDPHPAIDWPALNAYLASVGAVVRGTVYPRDRGV